MAKIVFPAKYLIEAARFMSTEETRYYLCGVCLDMIDGRLVLVATNGHMMGIFAPEDWAGDGFDLKPSDLRPIVGLQRLKAITAAAAPDPLYEAHYDEDDEEDEGRRQPSPWTSMALVDTEASRLTIFNVGIALSSSDFLAEKLAGDVTHFDKVLIDGTYPDWRRVVPTEHQALSSGCFNTDYLSRFATLGRSGSPPVVEVFGAPKDADKSPSLVRVSGRDDFFGIIMPVHGKRWPELPSWYPVSPGAEEEPPPAPAEVAEPVVAPV